MRRMILQVSPELLAQFFKDGSGFVEVVADPLPPDARIVDARCAFGGVNLEFVVESESFPELRQGDHLSPLPAPQFSRLSKSAYMGGWQKGKPAMEETEDR